MLIVIKLKNTYYILTFNIYINEIIVLQIIQISPWKRIIVIELKFIKTLKSNKTQI